MPVRNLLLAGSVYAVGKQQIPPSGRNDKRQYRNDKRYCRGDSRPRSPEERICLGPHERLKFSGIFHAKRATNLMQIHRSAILATMVLLMVSLTVAQSKHVLTADEVKKATPTEYFYRGQKAPVQLRNAVGFQLADGRMVLAALVDNSGYSTAIQQKYQGLLITETKLNIGGSLLAPGQYGFGFTADGKFMVMDVANSDVLSASYQTDQALQRAVPLKLVEDGNGYKLYAGKKWIAVKTE